jgi:hypothetical protein
MRTIIAVALLLACSSCWSARPPTTAVEVVEDPPEGAIRVGYFFFNKCGDARELMLFAQKRGADYMVMHHVLGSGVCNVALWANAPDTPDAK